MCCVSALLAWFCLPEIGQNTIDQEDINFRAYLQENGYDVTRMGLANAGAAMGYGDEVVISDVSQEKY